MRFSTILKGQIHRSAPTKIRALVGVTCLLLIISGISNGCFAAQPQQDDRQWSVMLYHGNTAKQSISDLLNFKYDSAGEEIYSAELAYALAETNPVTRFFNHLFINRFQVAGNISERHDYDDPRHKWVTEGDVYAMIRRTHFPWDRYLRTSLAFGEGLSYAAERIYVENNGTAGDSSPRFLNYLTYEITFALPQYPYLELIARIHHRSGAWGLFYPFKDHPGSNNLGFGIRYYFH